MQTRTYRKWASMHRRCKDKTHPAYQYYGGRGVTVCDRWSERVTGYHNFLADLGEAPDGLWLDRINNDGNYEPGNCKWSTPKEQANNRRKGGPPINPDSLRQKALKAGRDYMRVYQRIRSGWTLEDALSEPVRPMMRAFNHLKPIHTAPMPTRWE